MTPEHRELRQRVADQGVVIAGLRAELARLSSRDGNASIVLISTTEDNPFARIDLKIVDFGVADNCYVVELPGGAGR